MDQKGPIGWQTRTLRSRHLAILRFALTLDNADRLGVFAIAREIDRLHRPHDERMDFDFFRRTSTELCEDADSALNQIILLFGASYILFDGSAALRLEVLKQVWITFVVLATVGVLITAAITELAAHLLFGISPVIALLLGATISSTDPATLVPIFRQIRIKERVAQTVMSESAFNDPMAAIL